MQLALPVFPAEACVCVHGLEVAVPVACSQQLLKETLEKGAALYNTQCAACGAGRAVGTHAEKVLVRRVGSGLGIR